MVITKRSVIYKFVIVFFTALFLSCWTPYKAFAIEIDDDPMETTVRAASANIMFVLDDSGSMDWEFMTREHNGIFDPNNTGNWWESYLYVFDYDDYSPDDDHNYHFDPGCLDDEGKKYWKGQWYGYNRIFYNPFMEYKPWPGTTYGNADTQHPRSNPIHSSPTFDLTATFIAFGDTSSSDDHGNTYNDATHIGCNTSYTARLETSGDHDVFKIVLLNDGDLLVRTLHTSECTDTMGRILDSAGNEYRANEYADSWTDPYSNDGNFYDDDCINAAYCDMSCDSSRDRNFYISLDNVQAGTYYIDVRGWDDSTGSYTLDISFTGTCETPDPPPEPIIIKNAHYFVLDDTDHDNEYDPGESVYLINFKNFNPVEREIYKFTDTNGDEKIAKDELELLSTEPSVFTLRTPEEDLQNFANWFSYYRKREYTAKAAVSTALATLSGVSVGFYSLHERLTQEVLNLDLHRNYLLDELFSLDSSGGTPLRTALLNVGRYFDADDGNDGHIGQAPWASEADGGGCQQAFAIVMTDGYWNGDSPSVGNVDGDDGSPFEDNYSDTLADVARKFYDDDLNDSLPNIVPQNACDQNNRQHLVTYTISFGLEGELVPDFRSYHPCMLDVINNEPGAPPAPHWPNPHDCSACAKKIDDLWHAAINGRGAYYSAGNPNQLIRALEAIMENIKARTASGAAVSINSEELTTESILYQASYDSAIWTGNLKAFNLDPVTGETSNTLWEGQLKLLEQDWDSGRRIITSDGSTGNPFRFENLTAAQKSLLGSDEATQQKVVEFIRGKEVAGMRIRPKLDGKVMKLGDLVHSAPTLVNNTVFVGGNDGMLHAFNAQTGEERFAFVPNSVFPHLAELADVDYGHRFYVDLTPTVKLHATVNGNANQRVLVGGLGAGGKGYFALNITDADTINSGSSEIDVASMFLWEYPTSGSDPDLGISLSKISIVKTRSASHPYVVIFGNGYNSTSGHAVLYILDLSTGDIVKKIDTGAGNDNGLSTPAVIDIDGDFIGDYVYAGDLNGNLWKFDISSSNTDDWDIAFYDGSTPKPLFKAEGQPITARPDVMRHCTKHGFMVIFGTGKFLGEPDITDSSIQSIYGIWDYGDPDLSSEYVGSFNPNSGDFDPAPELAANNVELLQQSIIDTQTVGGVQYRTFSDEEANWETQEETDATHLPDPKGTDADPAHIGWYVNLGGSGFEGERLARDIIIRNGKAIIITIIPNDSPCSGGGRSVLYEIDACDGSRVDKPVFDVNEDQTLDEEDKIDVPGIGDLVPTGRAFEMLLHDPIFVQIPRSITGPRRQEFKYFSTSQGTIARVREPGDFTGIYYWIEW